MNVQTFTEFEQWTEGDNATIVEEKRAALILFCTFHSTDPHQLVVEAQSAEKTGVWLKGYTAEQRIQQFYGHLTTSMDMGGLGYGAKMAKAIWRRIRSFYTKYGVETKIEAIASWEAGASIRSLRTMPFETWDWRA